MTAKKSNHHFFVFSPKSKPEKMLIQDRPLIVQAFHSCFGQFKANSNETSAVSTKILFQLCWQWIS
jgi:hypothetical protein